jgi:methyl-accepting chemotaxis protein
MSFRLSQWSIGRQVLAALLIAVLALIGVSGVMVAQRWSEASSIRQVETLTGAAVGIGGAAHELQKERGASALFIGSKGREFRQELSDQRRASDAALAEMRRLLAPLKEPAYRDFLARMDKAERRLADAAAKRSAVDGLSLPGAESFAYYTETITLLLSGVYEISLLTQDPGVKDMVVAYAALLEGKERAGRERATGSAGFAAGKFDLTLYNRLVSLTAEEAAFFSVFRAEAEDAVKAVFDREAMGREYDEVKAMREVALSAGPGGDLKGLQAPVWFRTTTAWIDRLKAVEDHMNGLLRDKAAAKSRAALTGFVLAAAAALVGSGLALLVGWLVVRSISASLRGLTVATGKIAEGDLHYTIPAMDRGDEVGQLARAVSGIRAIGVASTRIKVALDNVSANVMVADTDGLIIYANPAVLGMLREAESDIRRELPGFSAAAVVGGNFDRFHRNPAHQRGVLQRLTGKHSAHILIGGRSFDLTATPVVDDQGARLGTVVEWRDATQLLRIQEETAAMAEAAAAGDFSRRIDLTGKEGFMLDIARKLNMLNETSEKSLKDVAGFLDAVAGGDLGRRINGAYGGMFARIQEDANRTADRLSDIVGNIAAAADTIASAASEVSAGTADLAERTEQQASSLEETAASMEQLSGTVRTNAESGQRARQVAGEAQRAATTGGTVAASAIEAMKRIEGASRKITEIIGVIDEIAFQTNLLALNAAVEAARAGEAGRGFAVVAQEVRNLAQRSAQASKEIKVLILDSDGQVKEGVELVKRAGDALGGIVDGINQVATLISDMAVASSEQAESLDQVNITVAQMDEMTQKNAALVEETTAATHELAGQAADLRDLVTFFRNVR